MLRFSFARSFDKSLKSYHSHEKVLIQRSVDSFMMALDAGQIPQGFGLTKMAEHLWECRADIKTRILFTRRKSFVDFLFVGNHHEVRLFIKHYLS